MDLLGAEYSIEQGLSLAQRIDPRYRPVFDSLPDRDRAALALYFLPHGSKKNVLEVTRPRALKWYCPFADQRKFPSGHRYCVNVYTGCEHHCEYCYAAGYIAQEAHCKSGFRADFAKDLDELDAYDVPPAPVHLSNSTDAFQPLEQQHRHTLFVLEKLAERRHRFTTVTLLTKNPAMLLDPRYVCVLQRLNVLASDHPRASWFNSRGHQPLRIEISLAFYADEHRQLLDPAAPSVASRMEAIRLLLEAGLPVHVRIDPLFPRDPLSNGKKMQDFGLPDVQSMPDLEALIRFCGGTGVRSIIYSVAKITVPRLGGLSQIMERMKQVYENLAAKNSLVFRGGAWRMPDAVANELVVAPFLKLCRQHTIAAKACKANLISTQ